MLKVILTSFKPFGNKDFNNKKQNSKTSSYSLNLGLEKSLMFELSKK